MDDIQFFWHEISKCDWSVFRPFHMEETPVIQGDMKQLGLSGKNADLQDQLPCEGLWLWPRAVWLHTRLVPPKPRLLHLLNGTNRAYLWWWRTKLLSSARSLVQSRCALIFYLPKLLISVFSMKPFLNLNIPLLHVPETQIQQLLFFLFVFGFPSAVWLFRLCIFELSSKYTLTKSTLSFTFYPFLWFLHFTLHPPHSDLCSGQLISWWVTGSVRSPGDAQAN